MTIPTQEGLKTIPGWQLHDKGKMIYRDFVFKNFVEAVGFVDRIVPIAERLNHHPDLHVTDYRKLRVELTTHSTGGLSDNDFKAAQAINQLC